MWATFADVFDANPGLVADEAYVQTLVEVAEARLLGRARYIPQRITDGLLDEVLVRDVVVAMVSRVVTNSNIADQSAGPFRMATRDVPGSDRVTVLASDLDGIAPASSKVGSVTLSVPSWRWQ